MMSNAGGDSEWTSGIEVRIKISKPFKNVKNNCVYVWAKSSEGQCKKLLDFSPRKKAWFWIRLKSKEFQIFCSSSRKWLLWSFFLHQRFFCVTLLRLRAEQRHAIRKETVMNYDRNVSKVDAHAYWCVTTFESNKTLKLCKEKSRIFPSNIYSLSERWKLRVRKIWSVLERKQENASKN